MKIVAFLVSLIITAMGALGTVSPEVLIPMARRFENRGGLYTAAVMRVILGLSLILSAINSRMPNTLRVLGTGTFMTGISTPFIGVERFGRIITWWAAKGAGFKRAWAFSALGLGLFIAWSLMPKRDKKSSPVTEAR